MSKNVALVACVSKKRLFPSPARDLYISDWYRKASNYARNVSDEWYILSAKFGLTSPDAMIEPYNETLNTMPIASRRSWAKCVLVDLGSILTPGDIVIILAGTKYREHLVKQIRDMGVQVDIPMEGLRIGEQLSWLSKQNG